MTAAVGRLILCMSIVGMLASHLAEAGTKHVITILHTNDIHGHMTPWRGWEGELAGKMIGGMDRLAGAIKKVRAERSHVLLLDAGDALGDTMIADETEGRAVLQLMNALGYNAMTLGNHEPDFGAEQLVERIREAKFPVLAANLRQTSGESLGQPYVIAQIDNVHVGIIGLAYVNTPLTTAKKNVEGLEFRDAVEVASELVPKMRAEGAQIVIALTHLGLGADKNLAETVPGIDLIVGGHSHNRTTPALQVGHTVIVQAGAHGSDLGHVDLTVIDGKIVSYESKLILLDHARVISDDATAKLISGIVSPFKSKLEEPIAEATAPIVRAQTLAGREPRKRDAQSPADSLFADILRAETGSDIALLPGVGYGVAISPGIITAADLRNLVPHQSKVVTMHLTGGQVREILEQSIENTFTEDARKKVGGMIQVSGLRFTYNSDQPPGNRIVDLTIGGAKIDGAKSYSVATNSMLADGGHNYATFCAGKDRQEQGAQFDMIASWMRQQHKISAPADVRTRSTNH